VLFSVEPGPHILASILPDEGALSLSLVIDKLAIVLLAVMPLEEALPMHLVLLPVALVALTIWPVVTAVA
jgi:hypothetical protein